MRNLKISFVIASMIFFLNGRALALVPLESLLLGDQTEQRILQRKNVINDLFSFKEKLKGIRDNNNSLNKKKVAYLKGLYEGGKSLSNFCKVSSPLEYEGLWQHEQGIRTIISALQFIGLDYTVKAISQYARYFKQSSEDYQNLVDRLVGGYCSDNLTVMSLRQLRKNLTEHFKRDIPHTLPTLGNNQLFNIKKLTSLYSLERAKKREFLQTVEIFKSLCSWGNDTEKLRLLYPLLKNPIIMSFIIRQMMGVQLKFEEKENKFVEIDQDNGTYMKCENLICRSTDRDGFIEYMPRSLGQSYGVRNDLKRIYCQDFKYLKKDTQEKSKMVKSWLKNFSLDDERLLVGQFISLISLTPDFFIRTNHGGKALEFARSGLDYLWDDWAKNQLEIFDQDIYYEEPLSIEVVDRGLYFVPHRPNFQVIFDINLGEFDRLNQYVGKIKAKFTLRMTYAFLNWIRDQWINIDPRNKDDQESLVEIMSKHVAEGVYRNFKKFIFPPIHGKIEDLIAREILAQLVLYRGNYFTKEREQMEMLEIPVHLQFGIFALKYVRYVYNAKRNKRRWGVLRRK